MANRRKQIDAIQTKAGEFLAEIETVRDEIEEAYNNMPDGLKYGEKGLLASERVEALGEWIDYLQEMTEAVL